MAKKIELGLAGKDKIAYNALFGLDENGNNPDNINNNLSSEIMKGELAEIRIDDLVDFYSNELGKQPYLIKDNKELAELVESIASVGILEALIVRKDCKHPGKYEIISGHRRKEAALRAGLETVPAVIRDYNDEEANILICDSNLHRENISYSEKAWAYRLKYVALKKQGKRSDLTSGQVVQKLNSLEELADNSNDSYKTIQRYIRLTYLYTPLLDMVDAAQIKFTIAVELSYLPQEQQVSLYDVIDCERVIPTLEEAQQFKEMSRTGKFIDVNTFQEILVRKKRSDEAIKLPKLNEAYITKFIPKEIRKMTTEKKLAYTQKALIYYAEYIAKHPEVAEEF